MSGRKRKIKKVVTQQESQASIGGRERLRHVNLPVYFLPIETVWFPLDGKREGRKKTDSPGSYTCISNSQNEYSVWLCFIRKPHNKEWSPGIMDKDLAGRQQ